jgi:hypothetical protein
MTRGTTIVLGLFGGIGAGILAWLQGTPTVTTVLTLPLKWLTEDLHLFPSESLANLVIVLPLWFVYWGCLGIVTALLVRGLHRLICRVRSAGGGAAKGEKAP